MGENSTENAMSPVQSVDSGSPKVKKSFFPKISIPNPFKRASKPEVVADITPAAVQTSGFIPESPASTPIVESSPSNVASPDLSASPASVDTVANKVDADLIAQMAAHINAIPGTARPPEMGVPSLTPTPTPTPTETGQPLTMNTEPTISNVGGLSSPTSTEKTYVLPTGTGNTESVTLTDTPTPTPDLTERPAA